MNQYKKLVENTAIFAISNFIIKITQYVIIALVTYKLTTTQYGIAEIIIETSIMLIPVIGLNISESLFRFSIDKSENATNVFTNSFCILFFGIAIFTIIFPMLSLVKSLDDNTLFLIYILTTSQILQTSIKEFVRGIGYLRKYIVGSIINSFFQITCSILFVYILNLNLKGYIYSLCISYFIEFIYYFIPGKMYKYISITTFSFSIIKKLLIYCIPLAPNFIMWWVTSASSKYFILWFKGEAATGIYAIASKIPALITIITGFFLQAWQVSAVESYDSDDKNAFYTNIFNNLWVFTSIIICIILTFLKPIVIIFVSKDFQDAWIFAPILVFGTLFHTIQGFLGTNYAAAKDSVGSLKSTVIMAIINILLNCTLIYLIGIQGAAIATLLSYLFITIYRYYDTKKYVSIIINNKQLFITFSLLIIVLLLSFCSNIYTYVISTICLALIVIINKRTVLGLIHIFFTSFKYRITKK